MREEIKGDTCKPSAPSSASPDAKADLCDSLSTSALIALQSDVQPVGHDYVEEVGVYKEMLMHNQPTLVVFMCVGSEWIL